MYNNVYIRESTICKGIGIFTNKKIIKNNIITWYYGNIIDYKNIKHKKYKYNKYIMEYNSVNKRKYMIGISNIDNIKGKGFAQLANDAIHYNLTYKNNNSYFEQRGRYIFLIATRNIDKNEEVLVSYGIEYWIKEINIKNNIYNRYFKEIINILHYLTKLVKDYFLCDVYELREIKDNHKIYFYLTSKKRWCINYNIWHYDDNFYISFKNNNNNYVIHVYYLCLTCKNENFDFPIDKINKTYINLFKLNT